LSDPCYNSTIVIWEKRVDILYFFGMALTGYVSGMLGALLGLGGGVFIVAALRLIYGVPFLTAVGTSSFMIGITATSAAIVRYARGDIDPLMAVPIVLFVFLGARTGAWLVPRTPNALLRQIFSWVAFVIAGMMILQALGIYGE
jgi:uncharacterized protein